MGSIKPFTAWSSIVMEAVNVNCSRRIDIKMSPANRRGEWKPRMVVSREPAAILLLFTAHSKNIDIDFLEFPETLDSAPQYQCYWGLSLDCARSEVLVCTPWIPRNTFDGKNKGGRPWEKCCSKASIRKLFGRLCRQYEDVLNKKKRVCERANIMKFFFEISFLFQAKCHLVL